MLTDQSTLLKYATKFLRKLDHYSVRQLCRNGNLTVDRYDFINNTVSEKSFFIREANYPRARGLLQVCNYEGILDAFPNPGNISLTRGRRELVLNMGNLDGDYDAITMEIDQYPEEERECEF